MADETTSGGRSILDQPEKPAAAFPKQAQNLFDKAIEAVDKMNYDYAIELLDSALAIAPDMVDARHLLREAETRRFNSKKSPTWLRSLLATILQSVNSIKGTTSLARGNWQKAFDTYERILKAKPKSIGALRRHAKAAAGMRMLETAINSLEYARKLKPDNLKVIRELGRAYMQNGNVPKAQQCFQKLLFENREDKEAAKALQDLAAMGTIIKGDWEDTETYRTKVKDVEFAQRTEREVRLVKSEDDVEVLIKDREKRLAAQPEKIDHYKSLADMYLQKREFDKAVQLFDRAIELAPTDSDLPERRFRTVMLKFETQIGDAEQAAEKSPSDEGLKARVEKLKKDKDEFALSDLRRRVAQYPTNLNLRLQLGELLMQREDLDGAIRELQVARTSAQKRTIALNYLGECFRRKGQPDMAVEQFERALSELYVMDSFKKEVMYNLGRAYEDLGDNEKALQQYKDIYSEDIGFRDVNERVQTAYERRRATASGASQSEQPHS
jgi:tetratricopeptide (TPR) repeat protein